MLIALEVRRWCKPASYTICLHCSDNLYVLCRQALSHHITQPSMPADVCTAALQGVQAALLYVTPARRATLLAAISSLSSRAPSRSAVKAACLDFQLAMLAKGGAVLYPDPVTGVPLLPEGVLIEWLQVGCWLALSHRVRSPQK